MVDSNSSSPELKNFKVLPYSAETLIQLLSELSSANPARVAAKTHIEYFREYFRMVDAKTLVVEPNYTDRDYLEDFAAFYVRCHAGYRSSCARIHFFSVAFDADQLVKVVEQADGLLRHEDLQREYIGFIVVKPLPATIIGRTCLKTYPSEGRRYFPVTRKYTANLLGMAFEVSTLAYQEQDTVLAACATSALWSVFQGTGKLFQHPIPSPYEITRGATEHALRPAREFPNKGLIPPQMVKAIRDVGLEPDVTAVNLDLTLKAAAYAYLRVGIPFLLLAKQYDPAIHDSVTGGPKLRGGHAVAVTGYSLGGSAATALSPAGTLFRASRIDKLYVHDDQVGPFARMELDCPPLEFTKNEETVISVGPVMKSSFALHNQTMRTLYLVPDLLIFPVYHKIRISFVTVMAKAVQADSGVEKFRQRVPDILKNRLEWDIFLTTGHQFKEELREGKLINGDELLAVLERPLPKFVWRCIGLHNNSPALEILFDATDIEQADFRLAIFFYDQRLKAAMQ